MLWLLENVVTAYVQVSKANFQPMSQVIRETIGQLPCGRTIAAFLLLGEREGRAVRNSAVDGARSRAA